MPISALLAMLAAVAVVLLVVLVRLRRGEGTVNALDDLEPGPGTSPVARLVPLHVPAGAWAAASRALAAAGRHDRAALAQWAADLEVLRPLLAGRHAELRHRLAALPAADPATTLNRAREVARSLVDDAGVSLATPDHLLVSGTATPTTPAPTGSRRSALTGDRAALLRLASHWAARADEAATAGELGLERREAELATYDAFLVGLAERHAPGGATVAAALGDLARTLVAALDDPEPGTTPGDDAALVRDLLAPLLPRSERDAYLALAQPVALAVGY